MIEFDESTHTYEVEGKKVISVTQLLRKHGLSPDYSAVPESILQKKAERGTLIHKEIEDFIKKGELGFTEELSQFIAYVRRTGAKPLASEQIVGNDVVAGTYDLMLNYGVGSYTIADIKTTSTLHKESVSWQLSVYAYLTGNPAVTKGQAFHFGKDGALSVIDIPLKPKEEVEKLLECERNGELYKPTYAIDGKILEVAARAQAIIEEADARKKQAEKDLESVKEAIKKAMEDNGITKYEDESLLINLIAPTERESVDSKRLKAEFPEAYEACKKTTPVKGSVRIKLKGDKDEHADRVG